MSKIRLLIIGLLFIYWTICGVYIFTEKYFLSVSKLLLFYIFPLLLYFIATALLILRKRWADITSLLIFLGSPVILVNNSISYCKSENLLTVSSCFWSVFEVLSNKHLVENFVDIFALIAIIFLLVSLFRNKRTKLN